MRKLLILILALVFISSISASQCEDGYDFCKGNKHYNLDGNEEGTIKFTFQENFLIQKPYSIEWYTPETDKLKQISKTKDKQVSLNGNKIQLEDLFLDNTDSWYQLENNKIKQNLIIPSKDILPIPEENNSRFEIHFEIDYNDNLYINNEIWTGNNKETIKHMYINRQFGLTIERPKLIYNDGKEGIIYYRLFKKGKKKYLAISIPYDQLTNESKYPINIDPSTVAGCTTNATHVTCQHGTFTGNWIHTNASQAIIINNATINGTIGGLTLNSTNHHIQIINSTINANGINVGGGNAEYDGMITLLANTTINISDSTLNSDGIAGDTNFLSSNSNFTVNTKEFNVINSLIQSEYRCAGSNFAFVITCSRSNVTINTSKTVFKHSTFRTYRDQEHNTHARNITSFILYATEEVSLYNSTFNTSAKKSTNADGHQGITYIETPKLDLDAKSSIVMYPQFNDGVYRYNHFQLNLTSTTTNKWSLFNSSLFNIDNQTNITCPLSSSLTIGNDSKLDDDINIDSSCSVTYQTYSQYFTTDPTITQSGKSNFNQTISLSQNVSFILDVALEDEDPAETQYYNLTATNNQNFTISFNQTNITAESNFITNVYIYINTTLKTEINNHSFNIELKRQSDDKIYNFPVYITVSNTSAIITIDNNSAWSESGTDTDTFTRTLKINNTGSYNASNCQFISTGTLTTFLTQNQSNFNITQNTSTYIGLTLSSITANNYNEYLSIECEGDFSGSTVSSTNSINAIFAISSSSSPTTGGGGGIITKLLCPSKNWSIETLTGNTGYSLIIPKKSAKPRKKDIILKNQGTDTVTVELQIINSTISEYININQTKITLEPNKFIEVQVPMRVTPPANSMYGDIYTFSIFATDNEACEGILSVEARVSPWGNLFKWSSIGSLKFPTILPALIISLIIFFVIFLILKKVFPVTSILIATLISIIIFTLLILFL